MKVNSRIADKTVDTHTIYSICAVEILATAHTQGHETIEPTGFEAKLPFQQAIPRQHTLDPPTSPSCVGTSIDNIPPMVLA